MASPTISTPAVRINDDLYRIVPNSLVYTGGEGETNVRAASAGSGNSESVHSENAETQISMCNFDVYLLTGTDSDIRTWKRNVGTNTIKLDQVNQQGRPYVRVFRGMSLINDVERNASADGVVSLEFKGDPMIVQ